MDLLGLLRSREGKTLEFKRDLSSPTPVLKTIVAFANTSGGTLLIGVDDGDRSVRGVSEPLKEEERIANLISHRIAPRLVPDIQIVSWRESQLIAVEVYPSPVRPHFLEKDGLDRGVYVRVGSTNRRADQVLIEELGRYARGEAFDESPMIDLGPEAIDFEAASDLFAPSRRLRRKDLTTLRIVTEHQGRKVPTNGGMILFGRERERYFPDAWVQAGRFRGTDKSRILDHADIRTLPVRAVAEAAGFIEKHSIHGAEIGSVRRQDIWNFPPVAVREAVVNAVVHSDYAQRGAPVRVSIFDDRLEVENPGLLPFGLTVSDLRQGISRLRNRVIGRVFHELGLIEQWGSGVQRMISVCRDQGLPEPRFEEVGTRFRVTLFGQAVDAPRLDEVEEKILALLENGGGLLTSEIAPHVGMTARAVRTRLMRLVDRGVLRAVGTSPHDPKRRYFRAE